MHRLLREPLFHFIALGGAVFAFEAATQDETHPPQTIVVDENLRTDLASAFSSRNGRMPDREELAQAVEHWVDDEILYREGVALGLDRHDPLIRSRVIEKMRFTLKNATSIAEPSDRELRAFYDAHQSEYEQPARFDFSQVAFEGHEEPARTAAEQALAELTDGRDAPSFGDRHRAYEQRTPRNVEAMFGAVFAKRLITAPLGTWVLLESNVGFHAVQVRERRAAGAPDYEQLRTRVESDWRLSQEHVQAMEMLEEVRASYKVASKDDA